MAIPDAFLQLDKPGTPQLYFVQGDTANYVFKYSTTSGAQTATGIVDGNNKVFTIPATAVESSLIVYVNGAQQALTTQYSYEASTGTITFVTAPLTGSIVTASYSGPINLAGLTSSWDIKTSPSGTALATGTGTVNVSEGSITVVLSGAVTTSLAPVGSGTHASTFVGTLTMRVTDGVDTKTLERAKLSVVV